MPFAGVAHWLLEEEEELAELEPRDFRGAEAATAFLYEPGTLSALVLTMLADLNSQRSLKELGHAAHAAHAAVTEPQVPAAV